MSTDQPKQPVDVPAVLKRIHEKAKEVKQAATDLSDRVVQFEEYLNGLEGRVETVVDAKECTLQFKRDGQRWAIFVKTSGQVDHKLVDCTLKIKMAAIRAFPDLLFMMTTAQEQLLGQLQQANKDYDDFIHGLKQSRSSVALK